MARISKDDKKKWSKWQGKRDKDTVRTALNIILQKEIIDEHAKSYLKDEQYIIDSKEFKNAVSAARAKLGLVKGKRMGVYEADLKNAVSEALKNAGLSDDWYSYMQDYIATNNPPEKPFFMHPRKIMVEEINEDNELLIRLKPGLRYEDYRKAWKVFSRPLGAGIRLNKPYTSEDIHLQMLNDKDNGLTYLEITKKHYPNADPLLNVDRVKKAVQRTRKRLKRDK